MPKGATAPGKVLLSPAPTPGDVPEPHMGLAYCTRFGRAP
jgi:hypothetical protein